MSAFGREREVANDSFEASNSKDQGFADRRLWKSLDGPNGRGADVTRMLNPSFTVSEWLWLVFTQNRSFFIEVATGR